jgi:hypothetical protein
MGRGLNQRIKRRFLPAIVILGQRARTELFAALGRPPDNSAAVTATKGSASTTMLGATLAACQLAHPLGRR